MFVEEILNEELLYFIYCNLRDSQWNQVLFPASLAFQKYKNYTQVLYAKFRIKAVDYLLSTTRIFSEKDTCTGTLNSETEVA